MSKPLVIVESPAKAKTIMKYLDNNYEVIASVGHIRDLPRKKLGIDIENGFKPEYVNMKDKTKVIRKLKKSAQLSEYIMIATDMDREGEAIAWHLSTILDNCGVDIKRIVFNEITQKAIERAVADPGNIDMNKVKAQQARRILDRLVGYLISPVLWKVFYRGLSAGRVQTIGLRLLCERENQIRKFTPVEYWTVEGELINAEGNSFDTKLVKIDGKKADLKNKKESESAVSAIKAEKVYVNKIYKKERKRNPYPAYITSTMQRDAASRLGFSAKKTMVLAQQLYEGVELGSEGSFGLISYMRTDSTRISDDAYKNGLSYLKEKFGKESISGKRRGFKKSKSAQDAHEAIRPTDCFKTPGSLSKYLGKSQLALYKLIWQRFLASLSTPAVYQTISADIRAGIYQLRSNGRVLKKKGFLDIMPDRKREEDVQLPDISEGEVITIKKLEGIQHFTEPPARFSESALIKTLEENGIGRPSTYASILGIIQTRGYASKEKRTLYPTKLGEEVWRILDKLFNDIFEIEFTAGMENKLDEIERAKTEWQNVIEDYYNHLKIDLERFDEEKSEAKKLVQEETDEVCEKCGRNLIKKWSRNGQFLACPGYPECKFTKSLDEEDLDRECPKCGGKLKYKNGRFGRFIACSNYPDCKYTEPVKIGVKCPRDDCDGDIIEKRTRRGKIFYGCSNYPKCDFASWDKPVDRECPQCGSSILLEKSTKSKGDFLKCPACKHEVYA
ncbi:MAG TPA: type I DNA topoisomerase [Candidatus Krumholzibacteriaceae bacterium]|nr:type I DNA topoisomerase [Candidatus Krumholzibacteriaceae bacterium]